MLTSAASQAKGRLVRSPDFAGGGGTENSAVIEGSFHGARRVECG